MIPKERTKEGLPEDVFSKLRERNDHEKERQKEKAIRRVQSDNQFEIQRSEEKKIRKEEEKKEKQHIEAMQRKGEDKLAGFQKCFYTHLATTRNQNVYFRIQKVSLSLLEAKHEKAERQALEL